MEVKHGKNKFYIGEESEPKAEMTYVVSGEHLIIVDHTHVSDELRGQGAGGRMLAALTDWARREGIKIIPLCPYAKAQMEKNEAYYDLIHS